MSPVLAWLQAAIGVIAKKTTGKALVKLNLDILGTLLFCISLSTHRHFLLLASEMYYQNLKPFQQTDPTVGTLIYSSETTRVPGMAKMMTRVMVLLAMALGTAAMPSIAAQQEAQPIEVASISGVTSGVNDPALQRAFNVILESQKAREMKMRRDTKQTAPQDKVVRSHKDINHAMILGGAETLPM